MKLYIGIDWGQRKHDICFLNEVGVIQAQAVIEHSQTGFEKLDLLRKQMGVSAKECLIGLETAHSISFHIIILSLLEYNKDFL